MGAWAEKKARRPSCLTRPTYSHIYENIASITHQVEIK